MSDILEIIIDAVCDGISITGMVIVLMMLIEFLNRGTQGRAFNVLGKSRWGQVVLGAGMGLIPGCFGGFAVVSMYSHRVIGFGALVAMMIASSGDEAFFMLAMIPKQALIVSGIIFILAIIAGLAVDVIFKKKSGRSDTCGGEFVLHEEDMHHHHDNDHDTDNDYDNDYDNDHNNDLIVKSSRVSCHAVTQSDKNDHSHRVARWGTAGVLLLFMAYFIYAFITNGEAEEIEGEGLNLDFIEERWLNLVFALVSVGIAIEAFFLPMHVVEEHLWNHVIRKHLLSIFLWTVGTILVIQLGLHYFDIATWTSENTLWMIVLAALIGLIPESGPHLIFVTLFAGGSVPFSVLLASCISQDGHAGLPLLAEDKRGFFSAKLINALIAFVVGVAAYAMGF